VGGLSQMKLTSLEKTVTFWDDPLDIKPKFDIVINRRIIKNFIIVWIFGKWLHWLWCWWYRIINVSTFGHDPLDIKPKFKKKIFNSAIS
jgi:hypothetical protein